MKPIITLVLVCLMGGFAAYHGQELKQEPREPSKVSDLGLHPKKNDSLKLTVNKMLPVAVEKNQSEQ